MLRLLRNLLIVLVLTAVSVYGVAVSWRLIGGGPLSVHGWIALFIGIFGTVALAWGLMALAFRSDRDGWDDRAGAASDDIDKP